jgi:hypothetical protein
MPRQNDRRLDDLVASPAATAWRDTLAAAFFSGEAREQALREVRERLGDPGLDLGDEQRAEAEALLLAAASLRAVPPDRPPPGPLSAPDLGDLVINHYPYPVAQPYLALDQAEPGAGAFGCLLDTFEALVHFLAVVAVSAYQRGGLPLPECNRRLAERLVKGLWSTGDLLTLLLDTVRLAGDCGGCLPYPELPGYLFDGRGKPTAAAEVLGSFVSLRNRVWGHGTGRTDEAFARALGPNRVRLEGELARLDWLRSWELVRPTVIDGAGRVGRADLLMGFRRRRDLDFPLHLAPEDLDGNGGCVRAEKSLLLVAADRGRYLPLFPLSLFGLRPNRKEGVFLLQGCRWQRPSQGRRLERATYVAYEAGIGEHTELANDLAASRLEQLLDRLTATHGVPAPGAAAPPAPDSSEDPDCDLPEVRLEQQSHLRAFVGREDVLREVADWIDAPTEGGYLLLLGPPGQGKSALLAELARREDERGGCLLHMIKSHRDPGRFVPALLTQAARLARARFGAAAYRGDLQDLRNSLVRALAKVRDRTGRAVLLADALDELVAGDEQRAYDPRLEFLPPALPEGVRVVLTCRPDIPLVQALRSRLTGLRERQLPPLNEADFRLLLDRRLGAGAADALAGAVNFAVPFARLGGNPLFLRAAVDRIAAEVARAAAEGRRPRIDPGELPSSYGAFFRDVYNKVGERVGTRLPTRWSAGGKGEWAGDQNPHMSEFASRPGASAEEDGSAETSAAPALRRFAGILLVQLTVRAGKGTLGDADQTAAHPYRRSSGSPPGAARSAEQRPRRALLVVDERLRPLAAGVEAPELMHDLVVGVELRGILTRVGPAGGALAGLDRRDIDVVRRPEVLGLLPRRNLIVVQGEPPAAGQPGVIYQQRRGPVVPVAVDRPVGEDRLRPLALQELAEVVVARRGDLGGPVGLAGEQGAGLEQAAGPLGLRGPDGPCLRGGLALDAGLPPREVERHHLVAEVHEARHRPAAGGLRVAGVPASDHNLELARRRALAGPGRPQAHGRGPGGDAGTGEQAPARDRCHRGAPPVALVLGTDRFPAVPRGLILPHRRGTATLFPAPSPRCERLCQGSRGDRVPGQRRAVACVAAGTSKVCPRRLTVSRWRRVRIGCRVARPRVERRGPYGRLGSGDDSAGDGGEVGHESSLRAGLLAGWEGRIPVPSSRPFGVSISAKRRGVCGRPACRFTPLRP